MRDPSIDPLPGDLLLTVSAEGREERARVLFLSPDDDEWDGPGVHARVDGVLGRTRASTSLASWRKTYSGAKVIDRRGAKPELEPTIGWTCPHYPEGTERVCDGCRDRAEPSRPSLEDDGYFTEVGLATARRIYDALVPFFEEFEEGSFGGPWEAKKFMDRVALCVAADRSR